MVIRLAIIVGAILAAVLWGPFTLPVWAIVAIAFGVLLVGIDLGAKRFKQESRLARRFWRTGRVTNGR